jgi:plastocyanin
VFCLPRSMTLRCCLLLPGLAASQLHAQGVEVSAKILMHISSAASEKKHREVPSLANVVVWLSPLRPGAAASILPARQVPYRLVQKNKTFTPHLLVVPTGTSVQFPNEDPFFHNVFSLFNGKRFDLGLYESGSTRSVRFDREGVSYIFCNIHPEMGSVVLALSTPYFGISSETGAVSIHNVPPGSYTLSVWSENGQPIDQQMPERIIQVSTDPLHLGDIPFQSTVDVLAHHKNKFGDDYQPGRDPKY